MSKSKECIKCIHIFECKYNPEEKMPCLHFKEREAEKRGEKDGRT